MNEKISIGFFDGFKAVSELILGINEAYKDKIITLEEAGQIMEKISTVLELGLTIAKK